MANQKYIAGIYNYCDRWCEKCAFANRCRVYVTEQANRIELPDDPDNPEFWDHLKNNFQDTLEMLRNLMDQLEEKAAQFPIDGEEDEDDGDDGSAKPPLTSTDPKPEFTDGMDWPEKYGNAVQNFFNDNEDFFSDQEDKFDSRISMGLPVDVEQLGFLHEALQTIRWFQHLIAAKIHRALSQMQIDRNYAEHLQSDGNGSAKIAMIGMGRSGDAWKFVQQFFPEKHAEVQVVLHLLQDTREQLLSVYPNWEQFHRPGFDDEPDAVVRLDYNPN